ncbi:MAG: hypothetical protein AAGE13_00895, partial [Pseudomonadota bacterium]
LMWPPVGFSMPPYQKSVPSRRVAASRSSRFYSVQTLPPVLAALTHINPIFYLIDGARYGIIGVSDSSPWLGGAVCLATTAAVVGVARWMLTTGYRLKP